MIEGRPSPRYTLLAPMPSPSAQSPALPLEDVAAIRAALDAGLPREQVLAEANVSLEAWEAAQARWLAKLADQAAHGRLETSRRFVELVDASRARADEKARETRRPWKHRKPAPAVIQPSQPPPPPAAPAPPPQAEPEWVVAAPLTQPAPSTQPAPETPLAPPVALRDPLPFKPSTSPAAAQAHAMKAEPARAQSPQDPDPLEVTLTLRNPPATARTPLPFQQRPPQSAATASSDKPDATTTLDVAQLARGPALPFAPKAGAAPAPPDDGDDDVGTTTLKVVAIPSPQEVLPFKKAPPPANAVPAASPSPEALRRANSMSLAQYAHLCADVRAHPGYVEQIRVHYGLDAAAWTALHKLWRERFDRDPALRSRWQTLVEQRVAAKR